MKFGIFGIIYLFVVVGPASAAQQLKDLRSLTKQWVALEQSIAKEAFAWDEKQTQLNDFINIAQVEVEQLQEELQTLENVTTTADSLRQELLAKQENLNQHRAQISQFLREIEANLRALKPRLPQPLQDNLVNAFQKMPEAEQSTSIGIADRMQTVVGILSVIQQFDNRITVTQEIQTLPDQSKGEVTTLYIGLAAGYYVTAAGKDAGYGYPTDTGWVWESQPSLVDPITQAIAIADGISQEAAFISLPITLKNQR